MTPQEKARTLRPYIVKAAESLTDADALTAMELFAPWAVDKEYTAEKRIRYGGKLYRVVQSHTSQSDWTPDVTPALYTEVAEPGDGTRDKPILYSGNMKLEKGLYYTQAGVVYLCTRGTGNPVYADLKDLVGHYVEVAV